MTTTVWQEQYGGPETLTAVECEEPHAGPGEIRVKVAAASVNPLDWKLAGSQQMSEAFGLGMPRGFGSDFAGTIDEVGEDVDGFGVGERVHGNAMGRSMTEHLVLAADAPSLTKSPQGLSDEIAGSLSVIAPTAVAAIGELDLKEGETVLIGGGSGGVGHLAVQLAVQAGARVIATASKRHHDALRALGAEPVTYGEGLTDRVRALAPNGVDAAADLTGSEVIETAVELGVLPTRITAIAAMSGVPEGVRVTGSANAPAGALAEVGQKIAAGELQVPIAATFPVAQISEAVEEQRSGHALGKVVVTF